MTKKASYGRMKETTIGGFVMSREYGKIKEYELEIKRLREEGYSGKQIAEKLGFSHKQIRNYYYRNNVEQRKVKAGIVPKRRGRPSKDYVVSEDAKVAELRYILARKEAKIKSLEMQNELMRDFLSLTERK